MAAVVYLERLLQHARGSALRYSPLLTSHSIPSSLLSSPSPSPNRLCPGVRSSRGCGTFSRSTLHPQSHCPLLSSAPRSQPIPARRHHSTQVAHWSQRVAPMSGVGRLVSGHPWRRLLHSSPLWPNTRPVTYLSEDAALSGPVSSMEQLQQLLEEKKKLIIEDISGRNAQKNAVFTNSELSLKYVDFYGFDFDYTLVHYTEELHKTIYELARDRLVKKHNYPSSIQSVAFDPSFAIRGLHCDIDNGLLMKIDAYSHIQLSSVYRGHTLVSSEEVLELYGGTHVPLHVMDQLPTSNSKWRLVQYFDLFSIPESTLLADISMILTDKGIPFDHEYLFEDIRNTVREVHHLGHVHSAIMSDLSRYVQSTPRLSEFLNRLKRAGKKVFIITNSPWEFVNTVMTHQLGSSSWRDLFDVIIIGARKPAFFNDEGPFRRLNTEAMTPTWARVTQLEPGVVYQQGNITDFIDMTKWKGDRVIYFGDHISSDLADPLLTHGWKTGAIIPEVEYEIEKAGSPKFKSSLATLISLENLLQEHQSYGYTDPQLLALLEQWKQKRSKARATLKETYNRRFGSVFRTEQNPTYFSRRLATFSNLYTSSLDNLMNYSLDYTFIPRRQSLPHEIDMNFDL